MKLQRQCWRMWSAVKRVMLKNSRSIVKLPRSWRREKVRNELEAVLSSWFCTYRTGGGTPIPEYPLFKRRPETRTSHGAYWNGWTPARAVIYLPFIHFELSYFENVKIRLYNFINYNDWSRAENESNWCISSASQMQRTQVIDKILVKKPQWRFNCSYNKKHELMILALNRWRYPELTNCVQN